MKSRHYVARIGLALITLGLLAPVGHAVQVTVRGRPSGEALPNFIFVVTDDQGWGDVAYNGHPIVQTPNIDAMASVGVRFDRFYAAASVCSPTRATIITGRSNYRMNINSPLGEDEAHLPASEITLPEYLSPLGYVSGHFGKWHVGAMDNVLTQDHVMPPWDPAVAFDVCFSTRNVLPTYDPYTGGLEQRDLYWSYDHASGARNIPIEEALNDPSMRGDDSRITMDKAVDFIEDQVGNGTPFFACICFHPVHTPLRTVPEYAANYTDPPDRQLEAAEVNYYSNVSAIDGQVGRLRALLQELGIAENTMLWFASDNGPNFKGITDVYYSEAQGGQFLYSRNGSMGAYRGWKRHLHEGGIRVPGIIEWPAEIPQPMVTEYPVVTYDFVPTVLDVLGIPLPGDRTIDGESIMPVLRGERTVRANPMGFHNNGWDAWMRHQYKIVRTGSSAPWELYDLLADPFEDQDLSAQMPSLLQEMAAEYGAWEEGALEDANAISD